MAWEAKRGGQGNDCLSYVPGPLFGAVLDFLAQLQHSGQMREARVLRGGEASKQPPLRGFSFSPS